MVSLCQGLKGCEPEVQEGSNIPYYCTSCRQKTGESMSTASSLQVTTRGKGKGKGKTSTSADSNESNASLQNNPVGVRRSQHKHKPVDRSDFVT